MSNQLDWFACSTHLLSTAGEDRKEEEENNCRSKPPSLARTLFQINYENEYFMAHLVELNAPSKWETMDNYINIL